MEGRRGEGTIGEWRGVKENGRVWRKVERRRMRHVHIVNNAALRAADFDLSILVFYSYTL